MAGKQNGGAATPKQTPKGKQQQQPAKATTPAKSAAQKPQTPKPAQQQQKQQTPKKNEKPAKESSTPAKEKATPAKETAKTTATTTTTPAKSAKQSKQQTPKKQQKEEPKAEKPAEPVEADSDSDDSDDKTSTTSAAVSNGVTLVENDRVLKAAKALLDYHQKRESEAEKAATSTGVSALPMGDADDAEAVGLDDPILLTFTLKQIPNSKGGRAAPKAHPIQLVHPIYARGTSVCLITKDPEEDYEKRIEESKIVFPKQVKSFDPIPASSAVKQVVGVSRLHKNFTQHEARRHLRDEFDLFVADEAVLPMLSKKLGSKFFEAKKQPIGIKITPSSNIGAAIGQVLSATVMHQTVGDSLAVKIASASWHTPEQVTANVQAALPVIAAKIPGGWKNVLAVGIKTTKSPQLPFYKSLPSSEDSGIITSFKKQQKAAASAPASAPAADTAAAAESAAAVDSKKTDVPAESTEQVNNSKKRKQADDSNKSKGKNTEVAKEAPQQQPKRTRKSNTTKA